MDQYSTASKLVGLIQEDHDEVAELSGLDLLDYMAILGVSFVSGYAARDAYHATLEKRANG